MIWPMLADEQGTTGANEPHRGASPLAELSSAYSHFKRVQDEGHRQLFKARVRLGDALQETREHFKATRPNAWQACFRAEWGELGMSRTLVYEAIKLSEWVEAGMPGTPKGVGLQCGAPNTEQDAISLREAIRLARGTASGAAGVQLEFSFEATTGALVGELTELLDLVRSGQVETASLGSVPGAAASLYRECQEVLRAVRDSSNAP